MPWYKEVGGGGGGLSPYFSSCLKREVGAGGGGREGLVSLLLPVSHTYFSCEAFTLL